MLCISGILIQSYETGWDYGYFCSISSPLYWCMQTYSHYILQVLPIFHLYTDSTFSVDLIFHCNTLWHCLVFLPEAASWFDYDLWSGRFLQLILNVFCDVWKGFTSPSWTPQILLCCMLESIVPNMQELIQNFLPLLISPLKRVFQRCDSC